MRVWVFLFLLSCARGPALPPTRCLKDPPPVFDVAIHVYQECPEGAVCIKREDIGELGASIGRASAWMLKAWLTCGPEYRRMSSGFGEPGNFGESYEGKIVPARSRE